MIILKPEFGLLTQKTDEKKREEKGNNFTFLKTYYTQMCHNNPLPIVTMLNRRDSHACLTLSTITHFPFCEVRLN